VLSQEKVTLIGAPPSPYTRKMIALLRYRHIPYQIIWGNPGELLENGGAFEDLGIKPPKPVLLPTFLMRDERGELQTVTDSTPIIRRLEKEFKGRSVIPEDPALCFLNYLLEDFGDEWVTKYMFHYRC
jgi:glutathione S-transferase